MNGMDLKFKTRKAPAKGADPAKRGQPKAGKPRAKEAAAKEIGGPEGPEPTRYGDWEIKGRCIDF